MFLKEYWYKCLINNKAGWIGCLDDFDDLRAQNFLEVS